MRARLWLSTLLILYSLPLPGQISPSPAVARHVTCDAAGRRLFGVAPVAIWGKVKAPKRLRYVNPEYPELPARTQGSGVWVGDALIGPDGRIRNVSVLRDLKFTPPFPQFSEAISKAILQWRYSPTTVDGKAVPVCMTVTVNINWQ